MEQKKKRNYGKMTAEELSAAVNLVKSENSGVFGVKDIRSAFKDLGVPMYSEFATTLVQQGTWVEPVNNLKKLRRLRRCLKKFQFMNIRSLYQLIRQLIRLLSCLLRMAIEFLSQFLYMKK